MMALPQNVNPPTGFKRYCSFGMATEFRDSKTQKKFEYPQNALEKVGSKLRWALGTVADVTIKEITNPVAIIGASMVAAIGVTIAFYPEEFFAIVPLVKHITPKMVQGGLYFLLQSTIVGVGLRAIGHFQNKPLLEKWHRGEIYPIHIGDKRV